MQFFKHYTSMRNDIKIRRLVRRYGIKGYGLYNLIIEMIADALSSDSPTPDLEETAQDIAEEYSDDTAKINEIMAFMLNQGLFEIDEITGRILCKKIYKFIDKSQTRSEEIRKMIELYKMSVCPRQIETVSDFADRSRVEVEVEVEVEKKKKRFIPPSLEEIKVYIKEKGLSDSSDTFYKYFTESNWHDMYGKKVRNWKLKLITWCDRNKGKKEEGVDVQEALEKISRGEIK